MHTYGRCIDTRKDIHMFTWKTLYHYLSGNRPCMHRCMCVCIYTPKLYIYIYIYIHTHIYTHTYTHTYVPVQGALELSAWGEIRHVDLVFLGALRWPRPQAVCMNVYMYVCIPWITALASTAGCMYVCIYACIHLLNHFVGLIEICIRVCLCMCMWTGMIHVLSLHLHAYTCLYIYTNQYV